MNVQNILRYIVLLLASGAMGLGILVSVGLLLQHLPENLRIIFGIVVFLYGAYRFAVAFYRKPN